MGRAFSPIPCFDPYSWGFAPCWDRAGPLALFNDPLYNVVCIASAKGAYYTSLERRPRKGVEAMRAGLKARPIETSNTLPSRRLA